MIHGSGWVSLEHLLLSCYPSQSLSTTLILYYCASNCVVTFVSGSGTTIRLPGSRHVRIPDVTVLYVPTSLDVIRRAHALDAWCCSRETSVQGLIEHVVLHRSWGGPRRIGIGASRRWTRGLFGCRCRADRKQLTTFYGVLSESQGQNLAMIVVYVPCSLDSSVWSVRTGRMRACFQRSQGT